MSGFCDIHIHEMIQKNISNYLQNNIETEKVNCQNCC